jgi:hypothetical protein
VKEATRTREVSNEAEGESLACRDRAGLRSDHEKIDPGKIFYEFTFRKSENVVP